MTETVTIAGKNIGITFSVQGLHVSSTFYLMYVVFENFGRFPFYLPLGFVQQSRACFIKENIQHIQKIKFIYFFLCLWVFFALLDPDPDPGTPLNPDLIRIRMRILSTALLNHEID